MPSGEFANPGIPELGQLEVTINGEQWAGEIEVSTLVEDMFGQELTIISVNKTAMKSNENPEVFILVIKSNVTEQLEEEIYSGSQFIMNYRENGQPEQNDVWVSEEGWVEIIEINNQVIQGVFEGIMTQSGNSSKNSDEVSELIISNGGFNISRSSQDGPGEEFIFADNQVKFYNAITRNLMKK